MKKKIKATPTKDMLEDNLLKPGEDAGEGYKGVPDTYPDKEIDFEEDFKKLAEGGMCRGGGQAIRGKGFKGVF